MGASVWRALRGPGWLYITVELATAEAAFPWRIVVGLAPELVVLVLWREGWRVKLNMLVRSFPNWRAREMLRVLVLGFALLVGLFELSLVLLVKCP